MLQQDPFREDTPTPDDEALTSLIDTGPLSARAGRRALFEESQVTDRVFGFIASDDRRAFDDQQARVFGQSVANELTADQANERYGVEGYLKFDGPVNAHRAVEMNRQASLRRYREDAAGRADLSALDSIGASVLGAATDPVMLPTWFIGGGTAALHGLGVAATATRGGAIARGAAIGVIDGVTGGAVAESINAAARLSTGEDYTGGDALRNILTGAALGGGLGGGVGALAPVGRPAPRRTGTASRVADMIGSAAQRRGENAATALRIAEIESGLNPRADNPRSSASGVFQFLTGRRSAWQAMGGGDPFDANLNVERGVELLAENRAGLRRQLGREPQEWELYLAHQQGQGGAIELLRNPNRPAVEALRAAGVADPEAAIRLNAGRRDMTAGEFAGKWRRKFGEGGGDSGPTIEAMMPDRPPRPTDGLTDNERVGAFTESLERIAEDAPVDLGSMLARNGLTALDEASAVPTIRGRWLEADTAITRRGGEVPVRFAVVELGDLKTSHTDDLTPVADYPQALQPRDRARPGAQAENYNLERDLNPALLMRDKAAAAGAPIVSPDGLVESGNGRMIALRRSAMTGTEAWGRYVAELQKQGIDTTGFDRPVLVRMRSEPMTGAGRADMAREMNVSPTEAFSPVEQARADARRLDADTLGLIDGDDAFAAANRPFLRGFVQRVAPNDANALTDASGALSLSGKARVQAALVQRAYGDDLLTASLFETGDPAIRSIGQALADAAPAWARMRAEAPRNLDITGNLTTAVALVREARGNRMSVGELLNERLGQTDLFGAEAITPETAAILRLMFRDDALTRPRGVDRLAEALRDYARGASATPAGPDLFGVEPDGRAFLDTLIARYAAAEGDGQRGLAYAGGGEPSWTSREAEPPVLDLRPAEPVRDRPGGEGSGQDGGGTAEGAGGGAGTGNRPALDPARLVAARTAEVSAYRERIAEIESEIKTSQTVLNTRGQGTQYHGARGPITTLEEGFSNDANIYGGFETFYTTDAADIATGYFRKQPNAVLYATRETEAVRFFDMEETASVEAWRERLQIKDDSFDDLIGTALDEVSVENATPNLRQIMDEARALSRGEGLSRSDVQEYFDGLIYMLQREGFGGMRHIGGLQTGRVPHEVKIYFRPYEQIELRAVPVPRSDVPPELAAKMEEAVEGLRQAEVRSRAAQAELAKVEALAAEQSASSTRLAEFIAADPELKALIADTEALAQAANIDLPRFDPSTEPSTIAEAVRAAAVCLTSDFDV